MSTPALPPESIAHYAEGRESERLFLGHGPLEAERTRELLLRHLPPAPSVVLDVGGGPGAYACWLAAGGYVVHLVDSMPLHVEQARKASVRQPGHPLASARLGDARRLDETAASADAVLLMGPLDSSVPNPLEISPKRPIGWVLTALSLISVPGGPIVLKVEDRAQDCVANLVLGEVASLSHHDDPDRLHGMGVVERVDHPVNASELLDRHVSVEDEKRGKSR